MTEILNPDAGGKPVSMANINNGRARSDAHRLAERIRKFWIENGFTGIKTDLVEMRTTENVLLDFGVRSNMINGWPPANSGEKLVRQTGRRAA